METKITMKNGSTFTATGPSDPEQAIRGFDDSASSKGLAAPPMSGKSWLAQKWADLDFWWFLNKPQWWLTASRFYWNHIRPIFAPQNRWATRVVPRAWSDKDNIIQDVLYAAVIDFVEVEDCFGQNGWDTPERQRVAAELREIYVWAKTGRAEFQERVCKSGVDISTDDWLDSDANWDEYNRLADELDQWDDRCLAWIVSNRGILST